MIRRGKSSPHHCSFCGRGKEEVMIVKAIYTSEGENPSSEVINYEDENEFYNYNFPLFNNPSG